MNRREQILDIVGKKGPIDIRELVWDVYGYYSAGARSYIHKIIKSLIKDNEITFEQYGKIKFYKEEDKK